MKKEVGEEEGKGNGVGCSLEGEHLCTGSFVLIFYFSLAGILGEVSGEGFSRISISSPSVFFHQCVFH